MDKYCEKHDVEFESWEICPECVAEEKQKKEDICDTEFIKQTKIHLAALYGCNDDRLNSLMNDFVYKLTQLHKNLITDKAQAVIKQLFNEQYQQRTDEFLKKQFEQTLQKTVVSEENSEYTTIKIEEIILNHVKKFFSSNYDSRDKRDKIVNDTIDKIIGNVVSQKVDDALQEIKTECIEKFQKEAMKKMMQGMATAINNDKRLLSLMTNGEI